MANAYISVLKDAVNPTGNALPADVLAGKTFSNADGVDKTGTMVNNGAVTITLTDQDPSYTVPQGYHNGSGTVSFTPSGGDGADLVVTCSDHFAGSTISCTDGTTTFTEICPSTSPYVVTFESIPTGTWTVSGVVEGKTYSQQVVITDFDVTLTAVFDYKQWVTLGGLDPEDYTDLEDVFADEVAVRRLMTIHASADYLIEKVTDDIDTIDDFTANDTAMKWIGLRDYVCDGLTAITGVEAKFLASQYWERYLKDHVPTMTSASAPYGAVSASGAPGGYESYKAFDNNDTTFWLATTTGYFGNGAWIRYNFTNPICVKKMHILFRVNPSSSAVTQTITYRIEGSNDGNTFESITTFTTDNTSATADKTVTFDNDNYYLYYRLYVVSGSTASGQNGAISLQFYGRSLNEIVSTTPTDGRPYLSLNNKIYSVSWTEREFAEGSTMKYLYDHGIELETINTTGTVTKGDDYITLSAANAQASHTLDLTPYDLLRGKVGDHMSGTTALIAGTTATANMTAANAPNNESLDVSNVNASLATGAKMTAAGICDITELWLE